MSKYFSSKQTLVLLCSHPWEGNPTHVVGYTHGKATQDQVAWLHLCPKWFVIWCEACRTIRDYRKWWIISRPSVPTTFTRGKMGMKVKNVFGVQFNKQCFFLKVLNTQGFVSSGRISAFMPH